MIKKNLRKDFLVIEKELLNKIKGGTGEKTKTSVPPDRNTSILHYTDAD